MQLRDIYEVDKKLIEDVLAIDALVYPAHLQGTYEEVSGRFAANRDMFILLYDDRERLIGYMCMFPVQPDLYEKIKSSDRMYDSDIPGSMVEPYIPGRRYKVFMISVAIHPDFQNKGLSRELVKGFYRYMRTKKQANIHIDSILAISVSKAGKRFLNKLSFQQVNEIEDGISLHELGIDDSFYQAAAEAATDEL